MAEGLVIDPTSEDAANVAFDLIDGTNTFLLEAAYPSPERDQMWASSADTEGDPLVQTRYRNRVITIKVRVVGTSASALQTTLGQLLQKVAKIGREGGTLKRTAPSGSTIVFDLVGATSDIPIDRRHLNINRAEVTLTFEAKPFGRGALVTLSSHSETTLPALVFTETGIAGDVPALGRLAITEAQGADQWWLTWGVQSRYYDSATTAKLFLEAEALTPLGSAATATTSGASGGTPNSVVSPTLTTTYQAILSTQASGGGSHLSHVGAFSVFARVKPSASTASVQLEWAAGDYLRPTANTPVSFSQMSGNVTGWYLADLGQVQIPKVATGTQRWEARVLAKGTALSETVTIDYLLLVPVSEGSGRASGVPRYQSATNLSIRDEFSQTAGNLNGKTIPTGGTWSTSGSSTDFAVSGSGSVTRSTSALEAGAGRLGLAGSTSLAATVAQIDVTHSAWTTDGIESGLVARYVDSSNYLTVTAQLSGAASTSGVANIRVVKTVAASTTLLVAQLRVATPLVAGTTYRLRAMIDANGRFWVWFFNTSGGSGTPLAWGQDSDLATGGTLASGKTGIFDVNSGGDSGPTRTYDNFIAFVPTLDGALFASRQATVRDDSVIRQDSTGSIWSTESKYEGDYLLIPPAGREARTTRIVVKAARNDPVTYPMLDTNIDDISATLTYVPRFLVVPE